MYFLIMYLLNKCLSTLNYINFISLLSLQEYDSDDASPASCSDVETFQGKIVYNPDGSAYIIDSENESHASESNLGVQQSNNPKIHSFRVVSAREAAVNDIDLLSNSSCTATNASTGNNLSVSPEKLTSKSSATSTSNQTKIHKPILMCFICKLSFGNTKSFTLHASTEHQVCLQESEKLLLSREYSSAILQRNNDEKPQLSFLEPLEQQQQQQQQSPSLVSMKQQQELQQKLINDFVQQIQKQAIAANSNNNNDQQQMNDQSSAMLLNNSSSSSLLKSPNHLAHNSSSSSSNNTSSMSPSSHAKHNNNSGTDISSSANNNTNNNLTNSSSSVMNSQQQSSSLNQQNSPSSSASSAVAANNTSSSSATATQQQLLASTNAAAAAKLLSEFLHQQQQQFQRSLQCPEHQGQQGVDCKNCEMLNITGLRSPLTPSKSPNSSVCGDMTSPTTSTPLPQSSGGTHLNLSPGAPSFTIGACPEHINGRPIGVECAR